MTPNEKMTEAVARVSDPLAFVEGSPLYDPNDARKRAKRAISAIYAELREPSARQIDDAAIDTHPHELGDISPIGLRMSPQKMFGEAWQAMLAASSLNPEAET